MKNFKVALEISMEGKACSGKELQDFIIGKLEGAKLNNSKEPLSVDLIVVKEVA